jgi:hypothetical protein
MVRLMAKRKQKGEMTIASPENRFRVQWFQMAEVTWMESLTGDLGLPVLVGDFQLPKMKTTECLSGCQCHVWFNQQLAENDPARALAKAVATLKSPELASQVFLVIAGAAALASKMGDERSHKAFCDAAGAFAHWRQEVLTTEIHDQN